MSAPDRLAFTDDGTRCSAPIPSGRWLERIAIWTPADPDEIVTSDVETAVILLAGTFDLVANGTAWPARGARADEFSGRPMAVFLPPHTTFRVSRGRGRLLLVSARQPQVGPEPTGREALARKPLLPLAGSGKAFDPNSGEWRPAETFATSPESLPPRRIERIAAGPCTVERVFAPDYKAATLSLDEVVLQPGQSLALAEVPRRPDCDEVLLLVTTEGEAVVGAAAQASGVRGPSAWRLSPEQLATFAVRASDRRTYVAIAYAGKPTSGS